MKDHSNSEQTHSQEEEEPGANTPVVIYQREVNTGLRD